MMTNNRRGFALLTAIWLVVAVAIAGLQMAIESRQSRLAAINLTHSTQARWVATAALDLTRARLDLALRRTAEAGQMDSRLAISDAWMDTDSLFSVVERIGGMDVHITLRSIGSKMNINRASETEFRNFFVAFGLDYSIAEELSQTIMDWRDTDDNYRGRGAERDFYEREGYLNLPRNNLFESVAELRHVYGMTPEIFEDIAPYLTVWGTGRINLNTAERPVLMSFTNMTEGAVSHLLSLRENGERLRDEDDLEDYLSNDLPNNRTAVTVDELEIEAIATTLDGRAVLRAMGVVRRGTNTSTLTNWRVE